MSNESFAQAKDGSIKGIIRSKMTQNPLTGVTIKLLNTKLGAISKKNGEFEILNISPGIYAVQFTYIGYETNVSANLAVPSGKSVYIEIELNEKVIGLEGVEVRASYFDKKIETVTSTQSLSAEDIRRAPGVQEDVIRAAALLPGVAITSAGRNDLIVRGGAPFENLFVVDNIEVANINHFGTQGSSGGPLSIINIDFVKNLTFSAGAFGSRYGDKVSSITNIELRNGNEEQFGGKLNLSATGFGINLEGPVAERGSFLFSARRSYLDFIFKAAGFSFIPQYWDFQGKFNYRLDDYNTLTFLGVGALGTVTLNNDNLDDKFDNSRVAVPNQDQFFTGLTWKHLFGNGFSTVTFGQTFTSYSTFQNDSNLIKVLNNDSKESESILRTDFDFQLSPQTQFTFGNQLKWASALKYDLFIADYLRKDENGIGNELSLDTNFSVFRNASYANITHSIGLFKATFGARLDYYGHIENKLYLSPRLSFIYQINDVSALSMSGGKYYQSPSFIWLMGSPDNKNMKPIEADQIVLTYSHTPREDLKVQLEVYHKWYSNYPARVYRPYSVLSPSGFDDVTNDIPFGLEPLKSEGKGYSRGFELFIQKKLSTIPLYGLLSLSISETKFKSLKGNEFYSSYDSRIIMNLAIGYRFNQLWEVSSKFRLSTGAPTSPFLSNGTVDYTRYNQGDRYKVFHALDVRADKRWNLGNYTLVTYLDIQNIYGRKNVSGVKWNTRTQTPEYNESIGLLPSIGINFEF